MAQNKVSITNKLLAPVIPFLRYPWIVIGIMTAVALGLGILIPLPKFPEFLSLYLSLNSLGAALVLLLWNLATILPKIKPLPVLTIEPQIFIATGPYRYSRNPILLTLSLIYLCIFFFLNNQWGLVLYIPLIFLLGKFSIPRKERLFSRRYGKIYRFYCLKTPRWL